MTEYERQVLAEISAPGSQSGLSWGGAMSAALSFLQGSGYVTRGPHPRITYEGAVALQQASAPLPRPEGRGNLYPLTTSNKDTDQ